MKLSAPMTPSFFNRENISSPFGPRNGRMHKGIDFSTPEGEPIFAIDDGKVILARADSNDPNASIGYGWYIVLEHRGRLQSVYAHLQKKPSLRPGDVVSEGQQIGLSGNTGRSSGPHLHFEIREGSSMDAVDPTMFYPELQGRGNIVKDRIVSTAELLEMIRSFPWQRKITKIHPHHTYKPNKANYNGVNGLELHQNMRNYHVNTRGFNDIAQHLTLLPDAKWVIGRDWNTIPASMQGNNTGAFMVEMVGDFHSGHERLEGQQLEAIVAWCAFCLEFFQLGLKAIQFHREYNATSCPGSSIEKSWFVGLVDDKLHEPGGRNQYFKDLPSDFYAAKYTDSLHEKGILNGRPDGTFGPHDDITRVEFITLMARSIQYLFTYHLKKRRELDVPLNLQFPDLPDEHWATPYVSLLSHYKILSGDDRGKLNPNNIINRVEAATVAAKSIGFMMGEVPEVQKLFFSDVPRQHWGCGFVGYLADKGIVRGAGDGRFIPERTMNRTEAAIVIAKTVDYVIDEHL